MTSRAAASNTRMNSRPMILRFSSGSVTPAERVEEAVLGVDDLEVDAGGGDEVALDLLGLAGPQQPVVDEHAGEAVADGPLHERGGHGRVDAAGQPAEHPLVAHRGLDGGDLLLDDVGHRPGGLEAGDVVEEVLEHRLAVLGVEHLRVELHPGQTGGSRSSNAATAAPAERAVTVKPSGAADTESPWLIHTDGSAGRPRNSTDAGLGDLERGCGRTRPARCGSTVPPRARAWAWKP